MTFHDCVSKVFWRLKGKQLLESQSALAILVMCGLGWQLPTGWISEQNVHHSMTI